MGRLYSKFGGVDVKRILECSTEGDTRFSALVAKVNIGGELKTIEEHYQGAKRFKSINTKYTSAKGLKPDWIEVFEVRMPLKELSSWYSMLWYYYFEQNQHLLKTLEMYEGFTDSKREGSTNSQADIIAMIKEYGMFEFEQMIVKPFEVRYEYYKNKQEL